MYITAGTFIRINTPLTLLHSERPKLYAILAHTILACLSAKGLKKNTNYPRMITEYSNFSSLITANKTFYLHF